MESTYRHVRELLQPSDGPSSNLHIWRYEAGCWMSEPQTAEALLRHTGEALTAWGDPDTLGILVLPIFQVARPPEYLLVVDGPDMVEIITCSGLPDLLALLHLFQPLLDRTHQLAVSRQLQELPPPRPVTGFGFSPN
jgi:hypothetical protein